MRVSRQKAAENRERIIDVAGALFREKGFDGIGVADIMKAAELTHGGFYGHFASKDDLVAAMKDAIGHAFLGVIAPFAFVCASLVLYWAKWPLTGEIILLMIVALPVYFYYQAKAGWGGWGRDLKAAWWLVAYLPTLALLSLIGSKQFGGLGVLPYGWDMLTVAAISLVFYFWGVTSGYRTRYLDEREPEDEILEGVGV